MGLNEREVSFAATCHYREVNAPRNYLRIHARPFLHPEAGRCIGNLTLNI